MRFQFDQNYRLFNKRCNFLISIEWSSYLRFFSVMNWVVEVCDCDIRWVEMSLPDILRKQFHNVFQQLSTEWIDVQHIECEKMCEFQRRKKSIRYNNKTFNHRIKCICSAKGYLDSFLTFNSTVLKIELNKARSK